MPLRIQQSTTPTPRQKPDKLTDGEGLFLFVNPNGSKWWRFKYRFEGKERLLSLGVYPDTGLKEARRRREEARKQAASGITESPALSDPDK